LIHNPLKPLKLRNLNDPTPPPALKGRGFFS
jgi:hypothetical protein